MLKIQQSKSEELVQAVYNKIYKENALLEKELAFEESSLEIEHTKKTLVKLQNKVRELSEKKSNIMKSNKILTNQISVVSEKCDVCEAEYKRTLNERNLVKRQQTATLFVEQQRYRDLSKKLQKLHQSQSVQEKAIEVQKKVKKVAKLEAKVRQCRELNIQLEADIGQKKQLAQKWDAQLQLEQRKTAELQLDVQLKEASLAQHLDWNAQLENKLQEQHVELKAREKRNLKKIQSSATERKVVEKQAKIDELSAQYAGLTNARQTAEQLYQVEVKALHDTNTQLGAQLVKQTSDYGQKLNEQKDYLAQLQKQCISKEEQQRRISRNLADENSQREQDMQEVRTRHKEMVSEIHEKIKSKSNEILRRQEDFAQLKRQNNIVIAGLKHKLARVGNIVFFKARKLDASVKDNPK